MKTVAVFLVFAVALSGSGCSGKKSDAELVEGLRGLYPGGAKFGFYSRRVIARGSGIVPELIGASRDSDPLMRESVARCLGLIGTDPAVERLIEMADDDEIEDTIWIALSYAASPKAIPKLEEELRTHEDSRDRGRLLITLAECGDRSRLSELLEVMKTTNLPGHVYHANEAFEKLAGRKFNENTARIEAWLASQDHVAEPAGPKDGSSH